jgi:hypothetical protein
VHPCGEPVTAWPVAHHPLELILLDDVELDKDSVAGGVGAELESFPLCVELCCPLPIIGFLCDFCVAFDLRSQVDLPVVEVVPIPVDPVQLPA